MSDLAAIAAIGAAFFVVTVTPGPANIGCASVAMMRGRPAGLGFALGLSLGLAVWGLFAAAGMGAVLQASVAATTALKLIGGAYLLWLAYGSARSAVRPEALKAQDTAGSGWFWRGTLLNLTNPKAVFAWMAALAVGLDPAHGIGLVLTATAFCAALGVVNYIGWALVFSSRGAMAAYERFRRAIDGAVAAVFALAGAGLIRSALTR